MFLRRVFRQRADYTANLPFDRTLPPRVSAFAPGHGAPPYALPGSG